jgi:hypothetical protein
MSVSKDATANKAARSSPSQARYFAPQSESEGAFASPNFTWSLADTSVFAQAEDGHISPQIQPGTSRIIYTSPPVTALGKVQDVLRSPGRPLDPSTRAYFEPRFGRDLSNVRLHGNAPANASARDLGARAYTLGSDIAFAAGEFQPRTDDGRALIAHELAHVFQQEREPGVVRRKLNCDPRVSLSGFLTAHGVKGFMQANNIYERPRGGAGNFEEEVLTDMLASPRVFSVDGDTDAAAGANLAAHVKARTGIVSFAGKKQYKFNSGAGWSMNPAFYDWNVAQGKWKVKPGVDSQKAWDDLNVNPTQYAIGCAAATDITMKGGSGGANIIDMPSGDSADWVPGDAGYVENTSYNSKKTDIGLMGENIIYTGGGQFWGHFSSTVTYRTLQEWVAEVLSWNRTNPGARIDTKREMPATGLLNK